MFEVTDKPRPKSGSRIAGKKFYALVMFPYPSAAGLHVGHPLSYTAVDIIARKRRMEGWNVLHPMGWDAFGLPAENYAIKTKVHPSQTTGAAIENFRKQIKALGLSYDWSHEVNTSSPDYYRWTQWLFLQLYRNGLAYKKLAPVNWCDSCQTVLANEQVVTGACERCGTTVVQKELAQWFFKITDYADRLLAGLEKLDWPEKIKALQRNWIGKSEGVEINFKGILESDEEGKIRVEEFDIPVFTTRADTLFGVTSIVLAPEHPLVSVLTSKKEKRKVDVYVKQTQKKTELERTGTEQEKRGVFIGAAARHPLTGEKISIWIADYVLMSYGTGAVMGVPAHDERDWEFARKNGLDAKFVVAPPHDTSEAEHERVHHELKDPGSMVQDQGAYTGEGILVNSEEFTGLTTSSARQKIADELESRKLGRRQTNWHLRDWLISRQRYWGANAAKSRFPRQTFRLHYPMTWISSRPARARSHGQNLFTTSPAPIAASWRGARATPWTHSWILPGIFFAIAIQRTKKSLPTRRNSHTGARLISMRAVQSTRCSICSTRDS